MKRVVMSCRTQDCGGDVKSSRSTFLTEQDWQEPCGIQKRRAGLPGFNAFLHRPRLTIKPG